MDQLHGSHQRNSLKHRQVYQTSKEGQEIVALIKGDVAGGEHVPAALAVSRDRGIVKMKWDGASRLVSDWFL